MANTKVTKAVLADDAVGLAQLDITNDPSDGQALTAAVNPNGYDLTWASVGVSGISSSADATAITIDSSERVGIGKSPTKELDVAGTIKAVGASNNNTMEVFGAETSNQSFGLLVNAGTSSSDYSALFRDEDANTVLKIQGDGDVLIGTTTSEGTVTIQGDANSSQFTALALKQDSSGYDQTSSTTCDMDFYLWDNNTRISTPQARIGVVGDSTADQNYEAAGRLTFYTNIRNHSSPDLKEIFRMQRNSDANSSPYFFFGTHGTSSGNSAPAFFAAHNSPSSGTNYYFQFLEALDNSSAASIKCGGLLASASYAAANPDRGDIYAQDNVSAASFTDRTPYPTSLQLAQDVINSHQRRSEEEITRLATEQYNKIHSEESDMPQPEKESLSLEEYLTKYKKEYELDHDVLHDYVNDTKYAENGIEGRDASATISCLVEVVKDLMQRIETLESN